MLNRKLGRFISDARRKKGLTLRDVERLTHQAISNAYVSQLESGHFKNPSAPKLRALAKALSLDYVKLLKVAGFLTEKEITTYEAASVRACFERAKKGAINQWSRGRTI